MHTRRFDLSLACLLFDALILGKVTLGMVIRMIVQKVLDGYGLLFIIEELFY